MYYVQSHQDHNLTYPVLVPSSVISEPMNESSSTLPVIAMAPGHDNNEKALEGDDINQAWFTTKEDKDSLQGKGQLIHFTLPFLASI